jgi:transcriptional regulator GlxA family with amidase domain
MQIAIVLYDKFTALDAIGPYEVLSGLPRSSVVFTAERAGPVTADTGTCSVIATASLAEVPHPDIVVVPGSSQSTAAQLASGPMLDWLRRADEHTSWTTSVCTGSMILAAAGLLTGRRATSHWLTLDRLAERGARPVRQRVVIDGKYITAAGVSAGIDMALTLAGRIAGRDLAEAIQLMLEYDPQPPDSAGSPLAARKDLVAELRWRYRHVLAATGESARPGR